MANRYDIIHIDFQASARGANAAIESIRSEAEKSSAEVEKLRNKIDAAMKDGASDDTIAEMRAQLKTEETRYKQFSSAQRELIKGMRVLDEAVKQFNAGSLGEMNALFQKQANNAAKLAQSKLTVGTDEWRQMGALMQETEQNYARFQRDTQQLIDSIEQGGTIFRGTLEQEKRGLEELMKLVPYMGKEYQDLEHQYGVISNKMKEMADADRRAKGEIVGLNDARRVANQLTEEGAAAAEREREVAESTISTAKQRIAQLEAEKKAKDEIARKSADAVATNLENLRMQQSLIDDEKKAKVKDDEAAKKKRTSAENNRRDAEELKANAETQKTALKELDGEVNKLKGDVKELNEQLANIGKESVKPQGTQAAQSSVDTDKSKADLEKQRGQLQEQLTAKTKERDKAQKKLNKTLEDAEAKEKEANKQEEKAAELESKHTSKLEKLQGEYDQMKDATDKNIEVNKQNQKALQETNAQISEQGQIIRDAETIRQQATTKGIRATEEAIRILEAENKTIDTNSEEWKKNQADIIALNDALAKMKNQAALQLMEGRIERIPELSSAALSETKRFWETMVAGAEKGSADLAKYEKQLKAITDEEQRRKEEQATMVILNKKTSSDEEIKSAIQSLEQLRNAQAHGSEEWERYNQLMLEGKNYLKELADAERRAKGEIVDLNDARRVANSIAADDSERKEIEATIAAARERLTQLKEERKAKQKEADDSKSALGRIKFEVASTRLISLDDDIAGEISRSQLPKYEKVEREATEKYNSIKKEIQEIEKQINDQKKKINEAETARQQTTSNTIQATEEAIRILEAENKTIATNSEEWKENQANIIALNEALANMKNQVALQTMEGRMERLPQLSDAALQETKRFWETMVAGAEKGSTELSNYEAQLKKVREQEQERKQQSAKIITGENPSLSVYSESEIRDAINAAKELHSHMASGSDDAQKLAESIANAESHIKTYGVEAARTVKKQQESDEMMRKQFQSMIDQMNRGIMPSDAAVKAQQQYWQRLIDDPKTAADNLQDYREQLAEVDKMQAAMVTARGEASLAWFQNENDKNASANEIKERVADLKAYRDSLPQETEAETIQKINEYLAKTGVTAKTASEGVMSLADALKLAEEAHGDEFAGSPQEIQAATKALNERRDAVIKEIKTQRDLGNSVEDLEDEFDDLTKKLRDLKFQQDNYNVSQEKMQTLMKTPMKAVNLDELRAAIKRADGELRRMEGSLGTNSDKYKDLAAQVKNAKNVLKQMENQSKATTSQFDQAWSRLKTYVGMYMGFNALWNKVQGTAGDLMTLSDKMGEVRKTTNLSADEVGRLSDNLSKMDTRTPITGLLELSAAAGQLGLKSEEDIQGFTEAANKLMVALPEMGKESATEMMRIAIATGEVDKIREQMKDGTIEGSNATAVALEKVASTIDRLRASSASTAPEITDFVKRVGAVGAQADISIDQVAALGSTVSSLGMRVEMSATALSRMIPAIRNNAFSLAQSLGVTPEVIRNLYDTGQGMEVILMLLQRIKDSGKTDEDSIEQLLGMAGMQDIMKELNQQGARAGIVFSGLSQNVDELRKQLGVASQAYEENIAIQKEYDKMNETTAAKWERLKNQIEEVFVNDTAQSAWGTIIDWLRAFVDFITDNVSPALQILSGLVKTLIVYWAILKTGVGEIFVGAYARITNLNVGFTGLIANIRRYTIYSKLLSKAQLELKMATDAVTQAQARQKVSAIEAKRAQTGLNKAMVANVWTAVAVAVIYLTSKMWSYWQSTREAAKEEAKLNAELEKEQMKVENLTDSIGKARAKREEYTKELKKAQKALEDAKKANDGSRESTERLAKAETDLLAVQNKRSSAMAEEKRLIEQFNNEYSKYLGFMLSEVSSNIELANARELLNSKLRETLEIKKKEAGLKRVEDKLGEGRDDAYAEMNQIVKNLSVKKDKSGRWVQDPTKAAKVMIELTKAAKTSKSEAEFNKKQSLIYEKYKLGQNMPGYTGKGSIQSATSYYRKVSEIREAEAQVEAQSKAGMEVAREESQKGLQNQYKAATSRYTELQKAYENAGSKGKAKAAADMLKEMDTITELVNSIGSYYQTDGNGYAGEEQAYKNFIKEADVKLKSITANRANLLKTAGKEYKPRDTVGGGTTTSVKSRTWGKPLGAESTDWKNMTADELVNRREQMNKFVRAIQTDTDVQAVLKEDAALMKAFKGRQADMRSVIEWYNTERLKIQDELHGRHLTNTGDWMDPKKQRARKKQFTDEMKAFLDELDAYYTERKTRIQEAGNEDGISEAEVQNRTLANEAEWRQRRAELQKLYADKGSEVTADEQNAIYDIIAERTGDSSEMIQKFIQKTVAFSHKVRDMNEQGAKEYREWMGKLGLGWERDYLKRQKAIAEHVKAINDIINKERPFNGITENLQENLAKMEILTADMTEERNRLMKEKADMTAFNDRQAVQELKRTIFLLGEAENAYALTIEQLLKDMREKGFKDWADAVSKDENMKRGLLAMLHQTYDAVQDAIKKESSLIKKQVDIAWNDILTPDGKSLRHAYESAISALGLQKDQVSRANSLINAGQASERVADKLAIKQMQIQLQMQEHYFLLVKKTGMQRIADLKEQARLRREEGKLEEAERLELDAQHAQMSLNLSLAEEQKKVDEERVAIQNQLEESQNRLYQYLREWSSLISSSLQSVFEASHTGDASYYNEMAKMRLTGKGGPGAGTYIIIDNADTEDATAHYEYLDERAALERQTEIENQNAVAEAWKKVMDDINMKMSDMITDQINAILQNASIDANTDATLKNTEALYKSTEAIVRGMENSSGKSGSVSVDGSNLPGPEDYGNSEEYVNAINGENTPEVSDAPNLPGPDEYISMEEAKRLASEETTNSITNNLLKQGEITEETYKRMRTSGQSTFAKLTLAANMYGIAYQAMSNDNLSTAQKFEMMAVQAAGQAAISMLTATMAESVGTTAALAPAWMSKFFKELGPWAYPVIGATTAVLGGLMGLATSKIAKSKSEISQVTGASMNAGRLSTGMLTYAEGNVNEFTDPNTLTPGRSYNVDGADGSTYRAKYTGKNPRTHITNGPEFHLVGEKGREAIIDAHTTRLIQMDEPGIWSAIQTLYNGGSLRHVAVRRRGRGVPAFADGNIDEFGIDVTGGTGMDMSQMKSLQDSIDRQSMLLEDLRINGIKATFDVYGKGGLVDSYDTGKKTVKRHGEKY